MTSIDFSRHYLTRIANVSHKYVSQPNVVVYDQIVISYCRVIVNNSNK